MPFPYTHLVSLLEPLSDLTTKKPPPKSSSLNAQYSTLITSWFDHHRPLFISTKLDSSALFSLFFPELRPDRVYNLREDGLVKVIARCLGLGVTRQQQLGKWRRDADGDLGKMVGRVMRDAENPVPSPGSEVTVEEIEAALEELSFRSVFSSQGKRPPSSTANRQAHEILGPIFRRISSTEGKWLTRAILKSYTPVVIPEKVTMQAYHFLLPSLWDMQNDLRRSLELLNGALFRIFPPKPDKEDITELLKGAERLIMPQVGVRIGRVDFVKARSCRNAAVLAGKKRMSMERKYDGEYCQIHIDLSKGSDWIKIFSKSGRDSTRDRTGIHVALRDALRILKPEERGFKNQCILEGELVVYCEKEKRILEFYHLRSHVSRSGVFIGTSSDERPDFRNQHLMLVLYDLLLLDTEPYLTYPYDRRASALVNLVQPRPGYIEFSSRFEIDFSKPIASEILREQFARGIVQRWEGFVLKPCESPYLNFGGWRKSNWIKLKKDYIKGLGDTADFAIVGGGYDPERGRERGVSGGGLTTFFVGVLKNKEGVVRYGTRPLYKVVFHVSYCIVKQDLDYLNKLAYFRAKDYKVGTEPEEYDLDIAPDLPPIDVYFTKPLVFEVMGGGFDKPSNCSYYILRWPRVVKIHWDRDWHDAVGFDELQELAEEAIRKPKGGTSLQEEEEEKKWVKRLEEGDGFGKRKRRIEDVNVTPPRRQSLARHATEPTAGNDAGESKRRILKKSMAEDDIQSSPSQDSEMETPPKSQKSSQSPSSWSPASSPSPLQQKVIHSPGFINRDMRGTANPLPANATPLSPLKRLPKPQTIQKPQLPPPLSAAPPTPASATPEPSIQAPHPQKHHPPAGKVSSSPPLPTPVSSCSSQRPPLGPLSTTEVMNIPLPQPPAKSCLSPLFNATVFLMDSVLAQPRLSTLLALHKPKAVYSWGNLPSFFAASQTGLFPSPLASQVDGNMSPPPSSIESTSVIESSISSGVGPPELSEDPSGGSTDLGKLILLIEFRTPRTSKRIIAECVEKGVKGIDCYDWRVVGHSDWKGEERKDFPTSERQYLAAQELAGAGTGDGNGKVMSSRVADQEQQGVVFRKRKVDWDLFYMVSV